MRLSLAAAKKYALIICMCLLAVISMYTCYLSNPNYSKSVWRRCCVPDRECCRRSPYLQVGMIPYCLRGPSTYMWRQKQWPFCCVCQVVLIQGSLESSASARAIFVTRKHKSTNLTRVTSVCTK